MIANIFSLLFSGVLDQLNVLILDAVKSLINQLIVSVSIDEFGTWEVVYFNFAGNLLELIIVEFKFHC